MGKINLHSHQKKFIEAHPEMSTAELARAIEAEESAVIKYKTEHTPIDDITNYSGEDNDQLLRKKILYDLQRESFFLNMKKSLNKRELDLFKLEYIQLFTQFMSGITYTDKMSIKDLIMIQIQINRLNEEEHMCVQDMRLYRQYIKDESRKDPDDQNADNIKDWREEIKRLESHKKSIIDTVVKLQINVTKKLDDLKATRNQRLDKANNTSKTFPELVADLNSIPRRKIEGRMMGLINLAVEKEKNRLMEPIEYVPGQVDSPFLIPEMFDNNKKEEL